MRPSIWILAFAIVATVNVSAMASDDRTTGTPARVPDAVQGVSTMIAPTTPALLSAAITAKSDTTQFRASFVPMRAFDAPYIEVLSEAKLSLLTDTSTSLTRPALTFAYNPFSLRGHRGPGGSAQPIDGTEPIACDVLLKAPPATTGCGMIEARVQCETLEVEKKARDVKDTKGRLVTEETALGTADEKLRVLLASTLPADADEAKRRELELSKTSALTTYQAAHQAYLADKAALAQSEAALEKLKEESATRVAAAVKATADCENRRLAAQWPKLNGTWIPMVGLTGFLEVYPSGTVPDPKDTTGKTTANLEPFGGFGFEGSLSFHLHERFGIDLYGSYKRARSSGAAHTELVNYTGGGITLSGVFLSFLKDGEEYKSADYVKEGFIPGLAAGASAQLVHCDGREQCSKMRPDQRSVTPFLDLRIKPQVQLRFSVPITSFSAVDKDGADVAPTFSIAGQVASL